MEFKQAAMSVLRAKVGWYQRATDKNLMEAAVYNKRDGHANES